MSQVPSRDTFDIVVHIGSLQPLTAGQWQQLAADLKRARHVVLAVAGSTRARSIRHPITLNEQLESVRQALPANERARVTVAALHLPYEQNPGPQPSVKQWQQAATEVSSLTHPKVGVRQFGVAALKLPPDWHSIPTAEVAAAHIVQAEADWREAALGTEPGTAPNPRCRELVPPACHPWLTDWLAQPARQELQREWQALRAEREAWAVAPYPVTLVTVDTVVECGEHVLLIRRGRAPGRGLYAVPGGFIEVHEPILHSAYRELQEETSLNLTHHVAPRAQAVFDAPERSQRGRVITHAFHFRLDAPQPPALQAGDDASSATWVPTVRLHEFVGQLHDDHDVILNHFLQVAHPPAIRLLAL